MANGVYLSSYCNHGHRLSDGKPVNHECRIIPPKALELERDGEIEQAIEILDNTAWHNHTGIKIKELIQ